MSDSNHVKKNLGNELYKLKAKFTLSYKTIKYLQRLFNYMCRQNKDNPEGIKQSLDALSRHPFNDHSAYDSDWCRHIDAPNSKFTSLPFGKPLNNKKLQDELEKMFRKYKAHSEKLANLKATQANESFNHVVTAKAPKSSHFSGSESLDYRVGAAVSQTNYSYSYILKVRNSLRNKTCTMYVLLYHAYNIINLDLKTTTKLVQLL